jgi:hypothetical protein
MGGSCGNVCLASVRRRGRGRCLLSGLVAEHALVFLLADDGLVHGDEDTPGDSWLRGRLLTVEIETGTELK